MTLEQAQAVWNLMHSQWVPGSVFHMMARARTGEVKNGIARRPDAIVDFTNTADAAGWNSYVMMNPTPLLMPKKASAIHISHWSWFLVDIDPTHGPFEADSAVEWVISWLQNYLGMPKLYYRLIDSGRGRQLWFPLDPIDLNTTIAVRTVALPRDFELDSVGEGVRELSYREVAPRTMGYWLDMMKQRMEMVSQGKWGCTIDTSVSDLPRVMRMPFTKNYKTGREASILPSVYGVNKTLAHKLVSYTPHNLWKEPERPEGLDATEDTPWQRFIPFLTVGARIFITEGASEGGRHRQATAALLSLKELGCGKQQTLDALLFGAELCSPKLETREILPMIERHFRR